MKKLLVLSSFGFLFLAPINAQNNQIPEIFRYFGYNSIEGVIDFGVMSRTAAERKINQENIEFDEKDRASEIYTYGVLYDGVNWKLSNEDLNACIGHIQEYLQPEPGHLYKASWMNHHFEPSVFYFWHDRGNNMLYFMYSIME